MGTTNDGERSAPLDGHRQSVGKRAGLRVRPDEHDVHFVWNQAQRIGLAPVGRVVNLMAKRSTPCGDRLRRDRHELLAEIEAVKTPSAATKQRVGKEIYDADAHEDAPADV